MLITFPAGNDNYPRVRFLNEAIRPVRIVDVEHLPFDRISLEMVFRGLYHFSRAYERGEADDPVEYFAAPENQDLGVVKRIRRKPPPKAPPRQDSQDLTFQIWA